MLIEPPRVTTNHSKVDKTDKKEKLIFSSLNLPPQASVCLIANIERNRKRRCTLSSWSYAPTLIGA